MKSIRLALVLLAVCLLGLVLACGAGGAGVRWGLIDPPQFDYSVSNLRVIADVATIPLCSQLINPGCVLDHPVPQPEFIQSGFSGGETHFDGMAL
jgi:hypothetical protein